jgi:hypothetical protein
VIPAKKNPPGEFTGRVVGFFGLGRAEYSKRSADVMLALTGHDHAAARQHFCKESGPTP